MTVCFALPFPLVHLRRASAGLFALQPDAVAALACVFRSLCAVLEKPPGASSVDETSIAVGGGGRDSETSEETQHGCC